jgi:hypothetical protein
MTKLFFQFIVLMVPFTVLAQVNGKYFFNRNDSVPVFKNGQQVISPWVGGLNSIQVSKMDLNGDAFEDMIIFDRTGNSLLPFVWDNSNNKWKFTPEYISSFPDLQYWVLLRDYNCDGKKDIFSYVSGGIGVWKNTSSAGELSFTYVSSPYVFSSLLGGTVANLYVSKVDIPDINDVDGDGDLDVLTFGIIGERIEFHQNQSIELGFGCDSLKYEVANTCWGHFLETGFGTNKCVLFDTCTSNVASPKEAKHSGSTVLSLDLNDDGIRDLLLGDVSFKNIVALFNDNKGVNMNTSMVSQDTAFPNGTLPVDLQLFPASFYEDIDEDGIKDLIFSPNTDNETENYKSAWMYKNYGTNTAPVFAHISKDWMQKDMIDVGKNASPVLFDYNNDGLLDLFVGNFGYFDLGFVDNYESKIALYENSGTTSNPIFTWVTDDFSNLSTLGLGQGLHPTFGDIDNDGDVDMIVGNHDGKLFLFSNSSNSPSTMNLSLTVAQMTDDNSAIIDIGYAAKPQLFDVDGDNILDLVIGEENANLNYYRNIGTQSNYLFRSIDATFGDVDVSEWWTTVGTSSPCLFKNQQGETQCFVGSNNGQLYHYNNIDGNLAGTFNLQDSMVSQINYGTYSSPAVGLLNNDTIPDIIIGNERGGLSIYYGIDDNSANVVSNQPIQVRMFPNPTKDILNIASSVQINSIEIYDASGRMIYRSRGDSQIDVSDLIPGIFIVKCNFDNQSVFNKFIKQ